MSKNNKLATLSAVAILAFNHAGTAHADWIDQVARWLKLTSTPSEMRAPSEAPQSGDIFIVSVDGREAQAVTSGERFRSPVFLADGNTLLALRGDELISVPADGGAPQVHYTVADAVRLLGVNRENADLLLLILKKLDGGIELAELELSSGQVKRLPNDPGNPAHQLMLRRLRGDDREYDGMSVYLQTESKARLGGQVEWTDIYVKQGNQPPTNISQCAGADCAQPSVSFDGSRIVFIKSDKNY